VTSDHNHLLATAEALLLADLAATFPGVFARPLREHGSAGFDFGVWTGGDAHMPDGMPIFSELLTNEPEYEDGAHAGFRAWLQQRGWTVENYDGETFFIVPFSPGLPEGAA
jgi:hypothetical protein